MSANALTITDIIDRITAWIAEDEQATGYWQLSEQQHDVVPLALRHRPGRVRAVRRLTHVVRLVPGMRLGVMLTSLCGEQLAITDAEAVPFGAGMPCENCLFLAAGVGAQLR
ncbi:MAG TPA: hypothetical protein VHW44_09070 [Pseudonocardiaceae bacterium]|nr:hypothetical protein [Pseudonocardiaceae bacterium]